MTRRALIQRLKLPIGFTLMVGVTACIVLLAIAWKPMGYAPEGARLERIKQSEQWNSSEGIFKNPLPLYNDVAGSLMAITEDNPHGSPKKPLPVVQVDPEAIARAPQTGLRITWLGHSTVIIDIDGRRFLTDPIFGSRTAPFSFAGPERWYAPPLALEDMPELDAVLISHDHYDHLDYPTMEVLRKREGLRFVVPLGVGAHLEGWGIEADRITEVDWWDTISFGDVTLTSTPSRHASGRQIFDQNRTLWTGYALVGPAHRVYFSGDTGKTPSFKEVGKKLGPFDVTMVEVGAYNRTWPDWHSGPEQAVEIHQMLRGELFLPIHWGLFNLASHGWTEPVERVLIAADLLGARVVVPRPGESIEPDLNPTTTRWWPELPFKTMEQDPLWSTKVPRVEYPTKK